jgi:anti-sigma B factor antagonist
MLTLNVERFDGTDIVSVAGEVDMSTAPQLNATLAVLTGPRLMVDLAAVTFMDSSGLHSLLDARNRLQGEGGELVLALSGNEVVQTLLDAVGLTDEFVIEND